MPRKPYDYYKTKAKIIEPIKPMVSFISQSETTYIDPCAGDNVILETLGVEPHESITNDIDKLHSKCDLHLDATDPVTWDDYLMTHGNHSICITNPPFNQAFEILQHAYDRCDYVVLLLRLSFLEPTRARSEFLSQCPPFQIMVTPRIRFDPDSKGSDTVTTAWMFWSRHTLTNPFFDPRISVIPNWRANACQTK